MLLTNLQSWIMSTIVVFSAEGSGATDTFPTVQTDLYVAASPSTSAVPSLRIASAAAVRELHRTLRVLPVMETESSVAFHDYIQAITDVCTKYQYLFSNLSGVSLIRAIQGLASDLGLAFGVLEDGMVDVRSWRRVANAVDPDARVIRIPRRFVRRVASIPDSEPWTGIDYDTWG